MTNINVNRFGELSEHLVEHTGAAVHVCHLPSNAMDGVDQFVEMSESARTRGVDVTTEALPHNAGSTTIGAAVFGRDGQKIFGITYSDVEWAATGEWFTESMWDEYHQKYPNGQVIHHYGREEWTVGAGHTLKTPVVQTLEVQLSF